MESRQAGEQKQKVTGWGQMGTFGASVPPDWRKTQETSFSHCPPGVSLMKQKREQHHRANTQKYVLIIECLITPVSSSWSLNDARRD